MPLASDLRDGRRWWDGAWTRHEAAGLELWVRGRLERRRSEEYRLRVQVEHVEKAVRVRISSGERREVPLLFDRFQDRGVVVNRVGDEILLGIRAHHTCRD